MMNFCEYFKQSTESYGISAAHDLSVGTCAQAAVYDEGLITLFDVKLGQSALAGWRWLLGDDAVALASTWQGNLIFWSVKHEAGFFLEVQSGKTTFIDRDVDYILNEFMTVEGVKEKFLDIDSFTAIKIKLRPLKYGECYIATPWLMLGGSGLPESFEIGDLEVYLSLIGQTIQKQMVSRL